MDRWKGEAIICSSSELKFIMCCDPGPQRVTYDPGQNEENGPLWEIDRRLIPKGDRQGFFFKAVFVLFCLFVCEFLGNKLPAKARILSPRQSPIR